MKLAVLAFLSLDARAGVIPQPDLRPYNEVLADFKTRVAANELPGDIADAGMNQMEIWTPRGGRVKHHRFNLETVNRGEPTILAALSESDPDLPATLAELDAAKARLAELEERLAAVGSPTTAQTTPENPNDIHPDVVPGLSSSEPPAETPAAIEDLTLGDQPDTAADPPPSPTGGGKKSAGKKS